MGHKMPALKAKDIAKVLRKAGFYYVRQKGSHQVWTNGLDKWTTLPIHPGEDIGRGLLKEIMNDLDISRDKFLKLL